MITPPVTRRALKLLLSEAEPVKVISFSDYSDPV